MQHRIVSGSEVITIINKLMDEKERGSKIALLNFDEITLYINTVKELQKDLAATLREGITGLTVRYYSGSCDQFLHYKGYYFFLGKVPPQREPSITITPPPPTEKLSFLLVELQQQKEYLKKLSNAQNSIARNIFRNQLKRLYPSSSQPAIPALESLDETPVEAENEVKSDLKSITESIKDAQDKVALHALESYQALVDQYKELAEKLKEAQLKETKKSALLATVMPEHEKLKMDLNDLQVKLRVLETEKKDTKEIISNFQSQIGEQKADLARLKPQGPLILTIRREYLVELFKKFNYSLGPSLFRAPNQTLANLEKLSKLKQELISMEQVIECIKDPVILPIFNEPYSHHDPRLLSMPGLIIRELAFLFREPPLRLKALIL